MDQRPVERSDGDAVWANRAASAETAVFNRHIRRLWGIPGTQLGVVAWPSTRADRLFKSWDYWWQAHLLDCLVDARQRGSRLVDQGLINRQLTGIWVRNGFRYRNHYFDDMAWLSLAAQRAGSAKYEVSRCRRLAAWPSSPTGRGIRAR